MFHYVSGQFVQELEPESIHSAFPSDDTCFFLFLRVCRRKFHGYNSLKEYYEEESCMRYLHRVSGRTGIPAPHPASARGSSLLTVPVGSSATVWLDRPVVNLG